MAEEKASDWEATLITWSERTFFDNLGRNGFTRAAGVSAVRLRNLHSEGQRYDEVHIEPITSRDAIGRSRIVVPIQHVARLIARLQLLIQEDPPSGGDA
jgi:hypothetical protein